ncbi:MAG TPA: ADOP family duplicated permease [Candidatus Cybelea sp.]|nr:ADOP family duplicated permease [Candidatus Cybelea sp.]
MKHASLVRLALLAYPADFRAEFREQIIADLEDEGGVAWPAIGDIVVSGLAMRAETLARDVAFGIRRLRRLPLLVAVVVASFALGIGANVAVFSVLDAVLIKPLPYPNAARLLVIEAQDQRGVSGSALSLPDVADLRAGTTQFRAIADEAQDSSTLTGSGRPRSLLGMDVSWNYFTVLGLRPELGRFFTLADGQPGVRRVVISDRLWRSQFGADPDIVGKSIGFDGVPIQIVGVAPNLRYPAPDANSLDRDDYWTPLPNSVPATQRGARYLGAIALLQPGATLKSATADLTLASARLAKRYARNDAGITFEPTTMSATFFGSVAPALWTVFLAVLAVLLIACANVANLLLADASTRDREFALRASLGASARRLGAQLFAETGVLAIAGGALGIALAYAGLQFLAATLLRTLPRIDSARIDAGVLLYAVLLVAAVTILSGMWPVAALAQKRLAGTLEAAGRSGDRSAGALLRSTLVVVELAVTLVLVVLSGLTVRSFYVLTHPDLGVRTQGVLASDAIGLPGTRYQQLPARLTFAGGLLGRVRAIPGVREAALSVSYPLSEVIVTFTVGIVGKTYPIDDQPDAHLNAVTPSYFDIFGIPLLRGRAFSENDTNASQRVALVNEAFVRRYLLDRNPIGTRLRISGWNGARSSTATIVGIVGNERQRLSRAAPPMYYLPLSQVAPNVVNVVAASDALSPPAFGRALDRAVAQTDPLIVTPEVYTIAQLIDEAAATPRSSVVLLGALAAVAFLLALSGVFGVVSFGVSQRYREFGVRRALGARARDVLGDVLRRALVVSSIGIALGTTIAIVAGRAIAPQLDGVSPFDPLTFVAVIALLLGCVAAAALLPAIRATRVDPSFALRYE